jgi:hypothetical protein
MCTRRQEVAEICTAPPVIPDTQTNLHLIKTRAGKTLLELQVGRKVGVAIAALSLGVAPGSVAETKDGKVRPAPAAEEFIATTDKDLRPLLTIPCFLRRLFTPNTSMVSPLQPAIGSPKLHDSGIPRRLANSNYAMLVTEQWALLFMTF